jgi:hypothetical protein
MPLVLINSTRQQLSRLKPLAAECQSDGVVSGGTQMRSHRIAGGIGVTANDRPDDCRMFPKRSLDTRIAGQRERADPMYLIVEGCQYLDESPVRSRCDYLLVDMEVFFAREGDPACATCPSDHLGFRQ